MGTYNISNNEIIDAIEEALDSLEGDFTDRQLKKCLEICKKYPWVSNTNKSENAWKKAKEETK